MAGEDTAVGVVKGAEGATRERALTLNSQAEQEGTGAADNPEAAVAQPTSRVVTSFARFVAVNAPGCMWGAGACDTVAWGTCAEANFGLVGEVWDIRDTSDWHSHLCAIAGSGVCNREQ